MSKLYVYTVRDLNDSKYKGLIPKLFDTYYNLREREAKYKINKDMKLFKLLNYNASQILNYYLNLPNIINFEQEKIRDLNLENIDDNIETDEDKLEFVKFLNYAHIDMNYGIYYSLIYANDDIDFRLKTYMRNKTIIYTTLDKLTKICLKMKNYKKLDIPILYLNNSWKYGKIDNETILLEEDSDEFINKIQNINLRNAELICQIPLNIKDFNVI